MTKPLLPPLSVMIEQSKAKLAAMTDDERREMYEAQKESWVRGMTTPCEHGVLDFEQCPQCRNPESPQDQRVGIDITRLAIGTPVVKVGGYPYPGVIVAAFETLVGNERFVVEATGEGYAGMLHIFNGGQLRVAELESPPDQIESGERP